MNIPEEIKVKRKTLKESQGEFGKRFGVSHASVSGWEAGESRAPYEVIDFCHSCIPNIDAEYKNFAASPQKTFKVTLEEI